MDVLHDADDESLLLSAREAAHRLRVSERTLWTLTQRGDVPHVRIGRRVLYRPATLNAWLATREQTGATR